MELQEAILKRRSIRSYKDEPVKEEDIKKLLELAMAAPSALNKQPWEFIVISKKEVLDEISSTIQHMRHHAPLAIIVCGNKDRFIQKPVSNFYMEDCSAAIENILLGALDLGLGTCWCGITPNPIVIHQIKKIVKLDKNLVPFGLVYVGYPNEEKEPRSQYDESKVHYIR